jgi:hypothetical protein
MPRITSFQQGVQHWKRSRFDGRIAQLVEQLTLNQRVHGSSPCAPTIENKDLRANLSLFD